MCRFLARAGVLAAAMLLAAHTAGGQPQPKAKGERARRLPEGTRVERDLRYGPHAERNTLDLYLIAKSDKPLPLVIWVHGGGWQNGSKAGGGPALRLLDKGFAVASINYRLSQHSTFPAQIEDCKAAVRFLRANARKFGLDPDRFGAWGSSAGGHLVALLGTSGGVEDLEGEGKNAQVSSRVQAVCDFYGPTDFTRMNAMAGEKGRIDHDAPNSPEGKLIGGAVQENKEKAKRANPITYVTRDDPPFLIVHGDRDPLVPLGQSEILHKALRDAGVESTLVVIEGGGHGGPGFASPETVGKIAAFFQKHLKGGNR